MGNPAATVFNALPPLTIAAIVTFFVLLLIGWLSSIVGATKSEKGRNYRPWLIFPLSHPFALIALLFRDSGAAKAAIVYYTLAFLALPAGGLIARNIERVKLRQYQNRLAEQGVSLDLKDLAPTPGSVEDNIWEHPVLKPLALAGHENESGREAREKINNRDGNSPYHLLRIPSAPKRLRYDSASNSTNITSAPNNQDLFESIHRSALSLLQDRDGYIDDSNTPGSWTEVATLIENYFQPTTEITTQIEDAIQRPNDHYPYEWEKAFQMLLPHLSHLRTFTISARLRSQASAINQNADEAFRMLQFGLQLAQTGDSDLLISRLVQIAQVVTSLEGIRTIQQFHLGTDDQWKEIDERLSEFDFPAVIADSLSAERAFGHASTSPLFNAELFGIIHQIKSLDMSGTSSDDELPTIVAITQSLASALLGYNAQAIATRNWTLGLSAYEEMIQNVRATEPQLATKPWNQIEVPDLQNSINAYGIFAAMLLPALDKAFDKAVEAQHRIPLAKTAIALERYYLAHQSYPEELAGLSPEFIPSKPIDPMTGQVWHYERTAPNGFTLYSYGRNGKNDEGVYRKEFRTVGRSEDDPSWVVESKLPTLPTFTIDAASMNDNGEISPEMMKRYGLLPPEKETTEEPNGE